jgi:hypothetical protein
METSIQTTSSREATSQPKSPVDVSDDEEDEAILKLNEDQLRELQKVNSIQCIESMRMLPKESVRLLPMTSRGWRLSSPMDIALEHPCSTYPPATCTGMSGL